VLRLIPVMHYTGLISTTLMRGTRQDISRLGWSRDSSLWGDESSDAALRRLTKPGK
jgi:hypothetical protein